jgi:hypothetical protein
MLRNLKSTYVILTLNRTQLSNCPGDARPPWGRKYAQGTGQWQGQEDTQAARGANGYAELRKRQDSKSSLGVTAVECKGFSFSFLRTLSIIYSIMIAFLFFCTCNLLLPRCSAWQVHECVRKSTLFHTHGAVSLSPPPGGDDSNGLDDTPLPLIVLGLKEMSTLDLKVAECTYRFCKCFFPGLFPS